MARVSAPIRPPHMPRQWPPPSRPRISADNSRGASSGTGRLLVVAWLVGLLRLADAGLVHGVFVVEQDAVGRAVEHHFHRSASPLPAAGFVHDAAPVPATASRPALQKFVLRSRPAILRRHQTAAPCWRWPGSSGCVAASPRLSALPADWRSAT